MTIEERANANMERMILGEYRQDECYILGATEQRAIDNADVQKAKNVYYDAGYMIAKRSTIAKAKRLVSVMLDKIEQMGINGDEEKEIWIKNFTKAIEQW